MPSTDGVDRRDDDRVVGPQLPRAGADPAVQVGVLGGREDVEFLAAIGAVAVADDPELLEDVERPLDGRGDGVRRKRATAFDELRAGDVAIDLGEHLDEDPTLRGPAQAAGTELVGDACPRAGHIGLPGR